MKKHKSTLIFAVLVVIGAVYAYYDYKQLAVDEVAEEKKERVYKGVEAGKVSEIEIYHSMQRLHLKKVEQSWRLLSPVQSGQSALHLHWLDHTEILQKLSSCTWAEAFVEPTPLSIS